MVKKKKIKLDMKPQKDNKEKKDNQEKNVDE